MFDATLCVITKDGKALLKLANRGVSDGKWNSLGGKIEGETPEQNVVREVFEESGLRLKSFRKHGTLMFYKGKEPFIHVHLFSSSDFEGELKESDEGKLEWFDVKSLPYDKMWDDDRMWMPLLFQGKDFDGEFVFDEKMNIERHEIKLSSLRP